VPQGSGTVKDHRKERSLGKESCGCPPKMPARKKTITDLTKKGQCPTDKIK